MVWRVGRSAYSCPLDACHKRRRPCDRRQGRSSALMEPSSRSGEGLPSEQLVEEPPRCTVQGRPDYCTAAYTVDSRECLRLPTRSSSLGPPRGARLRTTEGHRYGHVRSVLSPPGSA